MTNSSAARTRRLESDGEGVAFPVDGKGHRGSSAVVRAVFVDALSTVSGDAAARAAGDPRWRSNYPAHVRSLLRECLVAGPDAALATARAGLAGLHARMEFLRGGRAAPLASFETVERRPALRTESLRGEGADAPRPFEVPLRDEMISGDRLARQLDRWERAGIIEASHAHAVREVAAHPEWLDLSDLRFVLLGASAEVSPLAWLAGWRARIAAIDLPSANAWRRITKLVARGNATLVAPLRAPPQGTRGSPGDAEDATQVAGADLLSDLPELLDWIAALDGPLVAGTYAYLDGPRHVRVAAAMDALVAALCARRRDVTLAALATPTDAYAVPLAAVEASRRAWSARGLRDRLWQAPAAWLSGGRFFQPNFPGDDEGPEEATREGARYGLCDSLVPQQGANYALAKRVQQWRALVARAEGVRVSINVAPSTTTWSVVKNPALRAAFAGAHHFGVEAFDAATTSALMAALLVYDLRSGDSPSDPAKPLAHPLELLMHGANHGGMWRMPFSARSALPFAALLGWPRRSKI